MLSNEDDVAKMINPNPFCEVRLVPSYNAKHQPMPNKLVIELMLPDGSGYKELPGARVYSEEYKLVPNVDVRDMALAVMAKTGVEFKHVPDRGTRCKALDWNGNTYVERWYAPDVQVMSPQGKPVMLGLEAHNSYSKRCGVGLSMFAMNMVCANQFTSAKLMGRPFEFKHLDGDLDGVFEDALAHLQHAASSFAEIAVKLNTLAAQRYTLENYCNIRNRLAERGVTMRDAAVFDELCGRGITQKCGIADGVSGGLYGDPYTYWALANALTAVTTHMLNPIAGREQGAAMLDALLEEARI